MHGNLLLEESVTDLLKLDEDFAQIVKDKISADPENMLELNKVLSFRNLHPYGIAFLGH